MALVLASKSPRRRQLMALITPDFELADAEVDEQAVAAETPAQLASALAKAKAEAVFARRPADAVIGCDTVVEVQGVTLGKPATPTQAAATLNRLSGRRHYVHTGVCLCVPGRAPTRFIETTAVDFAPVPSGEIERYTQTAEPYDKAGGYGIQGWAARHIVRIEGCYYNVMGLPVASLFYHLTGLGVLKI